MRSELHWAAVCECEERQYVRCNAETMILVMVMQRWMMIIVYNVCTTLALGSIPHSLIGSFTSLI